MYRSSWVSCRYVMEELLPEQFQVSDSSPTLPSQVLHLVWKS
jgi:putative copper export protein